MEKTLGKRIKECRLKKGMTQEATSEVQNKKFVYIVGKDNKVRYSEIGFISIPSEREVIPFDTYLSPGLSPSVTI